MLTQIERIGKKLEILFVRVTLLIISIALQYLMLLLKYTLNDSKVKKNEIVYIL